MCQIEELSNIRCTKRAIYDHGNAVQISSRRRILGTREGRFCLTRNEIELAETACRNAWAKDGLTIDEISEKAIPAKAYFQYMKDRKPVLIIMLIQPEIKQEDSRKPNCKAFKRFLENKGNDQLIAFAIGFPGIRGEEAAVTFKVNRTWLRINGLEIEEDPTNEDEYDG